MKPALKKYLYVTKRIASVLFLIGIYLSFFIPSLDLIMCSEEDRAVDYVFFCNYYPASLELFLIMSFAISILLLITGVITSTLYLGYLLFQKKARSYLYLTKNKFLLVVPSLVFPLVILALSCPPCPSGRMCVPCAPISERLFLVSLLGVIVASINYLLACFACEPKNLRK